MNDLDYRLLHITARSLGREAARSKFGPLAADTVLFELKAQALVARAAAIGVQDAVRDAIILGASWQDVGLAVAMTRQGAHQRFAAIVNSPPEPVGY